MSTPSRSSKKRKLDSDAHFTLSINDFWTPRRTPVRGQRAQSGLPRWPRTPNNGISASTPMAPSRLRTTLTSIGSSSLGERARAIAASPSTSVAHGEGEPVQTLDSDAMGEPREGEVGHGKENSSPGVGKEDGLPKKGKNGKEPAKANNTIVSASLCAMVY